MNEPQENENQNHKSNSTLAIAASFAAIVLMVVWLRLDGRIWWCKLGDYAIYVNEAWNSSHTSQHFLDPYTFTHILHGVMFFWFINLLFKKFSFSWQLFVAVLVEAAWEILENSNFIIEKYRENTASLDYFGDSVLNSVGDVFSCAFGFFIAYKLGIWRSLIFFLAVEIFLIFWIRDSLLINILMLIYPIDAIKTWQMQF
ncbi:MAG TPA: DUF2585 family protein [Pyrinomonadaceae bacterium]|nr:DUF2585 family protein [Pyrinomonadaceae bacterium]